MALAQGGAALSGNDDGRLCRRGFGTCVAVGILLPPFLVAAPFTAGAMALYRRWAGVEPVPLPGDVVVRDARALVGADHAARRYRRVVSG